MTINTDGIVPFPKPTGFTTQTVENTFTYACAVPECGLILANDSLVAIGEQAREHRHQHVAAHTRQVVQRLEAGECS